MRCLTHKKETIGNCQWCGKEVCPFCVARKDGKKLYCDKCAINLDGLKPLRLPKQTGASPEQKDEAKKEASEKQRFIRDEDGYLVLERQP